MEGSFGSEDRNAGVCHECPSGVRKIHNPSLFTHEEVDVVLCFEIGNLLAEGGLRDVQSLGSLREVQLFGQDNDRVQVPNFNKGEHCSTPRSRVGSHQEFRAAICS
jgi:hypothetical protein